MQQLFLLCDLLERLEERFREGLLDNVVLFLFFVIFLISLQLILSGAKSCIGSIEKSLIPRARPGDVHPVHSP